MMIDWCVCGEMVNTSFRSGGITLYSSQWATRTITRHITYFLARRELKKVFIFLEVTLSDCFYPELNLVLKNSAPRITFFAFNTITFLKPWL